MYGDWRKAGIILKRMSIGLYPLAEARLMQDGKLILDKMISHIELQDLDWTPLSEKTVARKGHDEIMIETGWLKDNLGVRRIKSTVKGSTIFIGASPWKKHKPSGEKFSDIMIYLEYGTDTQPPRPLMRPTWEEVRKDIENNWSMMLSDLISGKGGF